MKNYVNLRNSLPTEFIPGVTVSNRKTADKYERSPLSKFASTGRDIDLSQFHPFGCPVYVLENALQSRHAHNKWQDQSRVGIYLCHSPNHSATVPLVLNTQTGNVSPQYHCIYDDEFATCKRDAKFISLWQYKAKLQLPKPGIVPSPDASSSRTPVELPKHMTHEWETTITNDTTNNTNDDATTTTNTDTIPNESNQSLPRNDPDHQSTHTTRYGRAIRRPEYLGMIESHTAYINTHSPLPNDGTEAHLLQPDISAHSEPHPLSMILEHVIAFIAKSDPDTMYLEEALKQPDRE